MLSLRHLITFQTVSQTNSFTKAAKELYITQSAVSHAIRELEEYTQTTLFDRFAKSIQLTGAGKLLLEEVTPIIKSCSCLDTRMRHLEQQAPLRVVSSITIASFWLPNILKRFRKICPSVPVYVEVVSAAQALEILEHADADLAFVEGAKPALPFLSTKFADYPLKLLCAPDYPLCKEHLTLSDLCLETLLLREKGSAIRDTFDSQLLLSGYTARPQWTSVNSTALIEATRAGLGLTVLPEVLVLEDIKKGQLIEVPIEDFTLNNDLLYVLHRDKYISASLDALLSCISLSR